MLAAARMRLLWAKIPVLLIAVCVTDAPLCFSRGASILRADSEILMWHSRPRLCRGRSHSRGRSHCRGRLCYNGAIAAKRYLPGDAKMTRCARTGGIWIGLGLWIVATVGCTVVRAEPQNLVADASFEEPRPANQFGHVFSKWGGWKYEGDCDFRVGRVAHSGKTSCLLFGGSQPKIRISQTQKALPPGRYKITAYIRGLDIGEGLWHQTTELAFDDQVHAAEQERHLRLDAVDLRRESRRRRTSTGRRSA